MWFLKEEPHETSNQLLSKDEIVTSKFHPSFLPVDRIAWWTPFRSRMKDVQRKLDLSLEEIGWVSTWFISDHQHKPHIVSEEL